MIFSNFCKFLNFRVSCIRLPGNDTDCCLCIELRGSGFLRMELGCLRRRMLLCCSLYRVGRSYVWHLPVDGRFEEERMHLAVIMEVPLGMCRLARKRQLCFLP